MSVDASVKRRKYPDERWTLAVNWAPALIEGETVTGVTAIATGVEIEGNLQLDGNISKVRVIGGSTTAYDLSARVEFLATLSSGDQIGFNLGVPTQTR